MRGFLRLSLLLLVPVLLPSVHAYGKTQVSKTGTMIYAQFNGSRSDSALYFYLNDSDNSVFTLHASGSPFSNCDQSPCLTAQLELLKLQAKCMHVIDQPFCAATEDYPYVLKDHKGTPSIVIGFSEFGWIGMNVSLTSSSALHDAFVDRLSAYENGWKPTTANAWTDESLKLEQHLVQMKRQEALAQYDCLVHLKIDDPITSLNECGASGPDHINSDLRGEQRVYDISVWGGGMYIGYREVLVYVDKQKQTIENVQWDDKVHEK